VRERIPVFAAALLALALLAPAAHAKPAPLTTVHCGQVITKSIRVANNLSGCPGDGLVVGAPGVTIDLSGRTLRGSRSESSAGVRDEFHNGLTVRNGTLRDFGTAVHVFLAESIRVDRVTSIDSATGFFFTEVDRATVTHSRATGGLVGVTFGLATTNSRVSDFRTDAERFGVFFAVISNSNVLERSRIEGAEVGIRVNESDLNTIRANTVRDSDYGALLDAGSGPNTLLRNDIRDSRVDGIFANEVFDLDLRENRVTGSGGDGIAITEPAQNSTLTANRSYDNGLLGMRVEGTVIDGGGNRAARNGDPRQCVGVSCRR
jgi:nitrous oxidase accessory protein NosD